MGRPRAFKREEVLLKAIPVFWEKGFSGTRLQDLEHATGVNKSGLYTEFKDKEEIFLESLRYYLRTRGGSEILSAEPMGWGNIRRFLEIGLTCYTGRRGCFSVNSLRDVTMLPAEAREIVTESDGRLKELLESNLAAVLPVGVELRPLTEMIFTFFAGLCVEQNAGLAAPAAEQKVEGFMRLIAKDA